MTATPIPDLSLIEQQILELMKDKAVFPTDLIKRAHGTLKAGTVYNVLNRMQAKGYVESTVTGEWRRQFRRTAYGQWVLKTWALADQSFTGLTLGQSESR